MSSLHKYAQGLRKIAKEIADVDSPVLDKETFVNFAHIMQVDGQVLKKIYDNLSDLEKADLIDYFELEKLYGRTDKTW